MSQSFICCITPLFIVGVFFLIVRNARYGTWGGLAKRGRPARGILLQVNPIATRIQGAAFGVERRQVLLDVELPGQAPVEVTVGLLVPGNLRALVLPGATVELRVHPKHLKTIALVGPGSGFALINPGTGSVIAAPGKTS